MLYSNSYLKECVNACTLDDAKQAFKNKENLSIIFNTQESSYQDVWLSILNVKRMVKQYRRKVELLPCSAMEYRASFINSCCKTSNCLYTNGNQNQIFCKFSMKMLFRKHQKANRRSSCLSRQITGECIIGRCTFPSQRNFKKKIQENNTLMYVCRF